MKTAGTIVTTIIEYVEADLGEAEGVPESDIGELFMKVAMTLSPRKVLSKHVMYVPLARVSDEPPSNEIQTDDPNLPDANQL